MVRKVIAKNYGLSIFDFVKKTNSGELLQLYLDSCNWSKDKIEAFQVSKAQDILKYAYHHVPFYKKRFDESGFNIEKFRYIDQLSGIPVLTRQNIQENISELVSDEFDLTRCKKGSSSGSTGDPIFYYLDNENLSASRAANIFFRILGGYELGDKWLNIWGNPTAVNVEWKRFSSRISRLIFNELRFPAYRLSNEKEFQKLAELIARKKPKFIYGYTNAIYLLAEYLRNNRVNIDYVKGVFTTAENLHDYQRESIESSLGKVFDQYGSSELGDIAAQIADGRNLYYILAPRTIIEFGELVDDLTKSQKLIVTIMDNKVLPFIRYENGDLAVPSTKEDDKSMMNFPSIRSIEGRASDIIKLPNGGSLVVPSFFGSRMLKNINGIVRYQIIKTKDKKIEVNLITNNEFREEYKKIILNTLNEYIPSELEYELVFNKPVILSKNSKFKLLVDQTNNNNG